MSVKRAIEDHEVLGEKRKYQRSESDEDDEKNDSDDADLEALVFGGSITSFKSDDPVSSNKFFIDTTTSDHSAELNDAWVDDDDDGTASNMNSKKAVGFGNLWNRNLFKGNRVNEFEKVVGEAPAWSKVPSTNKEEDAEELMTRNFNYVEESEYLHKGTIAIKRCKDLNNQQPSQKGLNACKFHRSAQIALTAAPDCRLNLFQVDGKTNPKIHSFFTEHFPIQCADFLSSGDKIVMSAKLRWFYEYDMIAGKVTKFSGIKGVNGATLGKFKVSPDGKFLLFFSTHGHMHLISTLTKELVHTMKINGIVNDAVFTKNGSQLLTFGDEGMVNIWDVSSRLCVHSFSDDGCNVGSALALSPDGKYVACGSSSGIVNIYDAACFSEDNPLPIKIVKNLQTSINCLEFNSTSEMLVMSSSTIENAVKLVHINSLTTFSNFPGFENKMIKFPRVVDFSPNSGYLTIGNHIGRAMLFRLDHYKSY